MKGWLDKYEYGGQAGYTDVPFKYNSAWGGQFQPGGKLPIASSSSVKRNTLSKIGTDGKNDVNEFINYATIINSYPDIANDTSYIMNKIGPAGEEQFFYNTNRGNPISNYNKGRKVVEVSNSISDDLRKKILAGVGQFQMGGSLPGAVGFTYARTGGIPSNGPYAKKTKASAQDGEIVSQTDPEVEQARQSMFDFYSNRPANLSGDIASEAVQNVNIEEIPLERLQKQNAYGLYYPGTNTVGYNNQMVTLEGYDPYDELQILEHEIGHSVYESLPKNEQQIIEESIITPKEFKERFPKGEISRKWSKYVTKPTEFYTRRNRMFDVFGIDPSQPITDEKAQEMIDFRKWMGSSTSSEEKAELLKNHPNFNKYLENYESSENKSEISDFMNSIKNDVPTYKRVFNEVTAVPGEQLPIAQNGKITKRSDSAFEDIVEVFDPTGISSWDDIYRSYQKSGMQGDTPMEILGAIPLLGKVGKIAKANKALAKTSRQAKSVNKFVNATKAAGITGRASDASQLIGGYAPDEIFPDAGKDIIKYEPFGPKYNNGGSMTYYQHGLDWKPKSISKNGGWLDKYEVPKNQNAQYQVPSFNMPRAASESTATRFFDPVTKRMVSTATTGQKKEDVKASTEAMGKAKQLEKKEEKQRVAERKSAVAAKDKGKPFTLPSGETKKYEDMDAREKMYVSGKALEQRGRFNEDEESFLDEYINPLNVIGSMAGGLGTAPYEARESDSNLPYLTAIGTPLITGALGFDPLGSTINTGKKIGQSMESGLLSNLKPKYYKSAADRTWPMRFGETYSNVVDEYKALKKMHEISPENVIKPYDLKLDAEGNALGYKMQKFRGQNLNEYINSGKEVSPEIKQQIKETVGKLHDAGLAHGDLFGNIMINNKGNKFKIIDPVGYLPGEIFPNFAEAKIEDLGVLDELLGKEVLKPKSSFKSDINWGAWNSEIPSNQGLINEYNAIEQTSKANGSWMKNPDGSAFQGTPEQFVQQNSENFKKAFPEGHLSAYRGSQAFDPTLSKSLRGNSNNHILFGTSDKPTAEIYATNGGYNLDHLFKDVGKKPNFFHPNESVEGVYTGMEKDINPGMYQYALDKRLPTITAEGSGKHWNNISNDETLEWLKNNNPESINYRIGASLDPNLVKTDDVASYMINKDIPIGVSKNTIDSYNGIPSDVFMSNSKLARPKSLMYNNGMFDMTNPNIYKSVISGLGLGTLGASALQQKKQGGVIKDDMGQWAHPGEITEIGSNQITMKGVPYPVLGISDTGDTQMMYPEQEYKFKGKKVTEYPMAQKGRKVAPVYVNDPNDPRLKLYTDSLSTYNKSLNPWHWPGTKVTTKQDYEKKLKLQRDFPHWSFDEDQYKKDKKKGKFKDFNDYMYDVGMAEKGDPKALDAFNRNTGKHFKDFEEPIEKKLPDGRIKQYWGTYKGKLDESNYTIYDPVTGSSSHYTHSGNGPDTFLGIYNPNIKPIGHIYHAFDQPYNVGETHISSEDSEYVNKVLKNKTKKKKDYTNYTYGANDNGVYKEPVQPVIYNKKKYNPNDPRLKQLQESFDKFHSNIGKKSKEQPKKSEPKPEEPTLKKKVSKMEPIKSSYTPSLSIRTIQTPDIELPGIQMGDYEVSYYSPESKDWANRRFTSQEESDRFAQEMSQRGYPGSYGNVTQTKKTNKKSTGGWLDKYN